MLVGHILPYLVKFNGVMKSSYMLLGRYNFSYFVVMFLWDDPAYNVDNQDLCHFQSVYMDAYFNRLLVDLSF